MEDIWAEGAASLFFSVSGISKLLSGEEGPPSLAAILSEDDVIQETQAQSSKLIEFLTQPQHLAELLTFVTVPVDPGVAGEDRAYKSPFRTCEVLACAVPALLDAITDRRQQHLESLFSVFTTQAAGYLPPYLYGYLAKVIAVLCKHRPCAVARYLDHMPGVAAGLFAHMANGSVASLVQALLALPWGPGQGMLAPAAADLSVQEGAGPCLSRFDASTASLPALCVSTLQRSLDTVCAARSGGGAVSEAAVEAAVGAAQAVSSLVVEAIKRGQCCEPHPKYAAEGYASEYLRAKRAASGDNEHGGHGSTQSTHAGPSSSSSQLAALEASDPFCVANTQVDASLLASTVEPTTSIYVRLLKSFRDGMATAPALAKLAAAAASALSSSSIEAASTSLQSVCEAIFLVLKTIISVCGFTWAQAGLAQAAGAGGDGVPSSHLSILLAGRPQPETSSSVPCPTLLSALCQAPANGQASPLAQLIAAAAVVSATHGAKSDSTGIEGTATAYPSYVGAPRLGLGGLALFGCLGAVTRCGWPAVSAAVLQDKLFCTLLDAYTAFPWHSLLHNCLTEAVVETITSCPPEFVAHALVRDGRLLTCIVHWVRTSAMAQGVAGPHTGPTRGGYGPHVACIANHLVARVAAINTSNATEESLAVLVRSHSDFWRVYDAQVAVFNVRRGVLVAGKMAPDLRKSGQVGANADATGKPAAVDEVSGLDDGNGSDSDEEDRRSDGSGSGDEDGAGEGDRVGLRSQRLVGGGEERGWSSAGVPGPASDDEEGSEDEEEDEESEDRAQTVAAGEASGSAGGVETDFDAVFNALEEAMDSDDDEEGPSSAAVDEWGSSAWDEGAAAAAFNTSSPSAAATTPSATGFDDFDAFPSHPAAPVSTAATVGDGFDDFDAGFPPAPAPAPAATAPPAEGADDFWNAAFDAPAEAGASQPSKSHDFEF